jgi:hypothetical protein
MDKIIAVIKKFGRGIKNTYSFASDWRYRHEVMEKYWNWKSKSLVVLLVPSLIVCGVMSIDRDVKPVPQKDGTTKMVGKSSWGMLYDCVAEEWDVERDTQFSILTGSCTIDSGRKDSGGNVIWSKVDRDIAAGDM